MPYNLLVALVLTRVLVEKEIKSIEHKESVPVNPQVTAAPGCEQGAVAKAVPRSEDSRAGAVHLMEK